MKDNKIKKNNNKNNNNKKKKKNKPEYLNKYNPSNKKEIIEYFPRGNNSKKNEDFNFNTGIINKSKNNFLSKKRKNENKQILSSKNNKKNNNDLNKIEIDFNENNNISRVFMPNFKVGDLVLLSISEIYKDYMILNYTRNKKAMVHSSYSGLDDIKNFDFNNYFKIGQFLIGAVISPGNDIHIQNSGRLNKKILVTINPSIINTGLNVENIVEGMDVYGQLIYDNKNKKLNADLKLSDGDNNNKNKFNEDEEEEISEKINNYNYLVNLVDINNNENNKFILNSYYFFKVIKKTFDKKSKKYLITVSLNSSDNKLNIKNIDFNILKPGFLFKGNFTKKMINGTEVSFGGNLGYIFIDHIKNENKNKNVLMRIIHVAINKKTTALSTLNNIVKLFDEDVEKKNNLIGKRYDAIVEKLLYGKAYQCKLFNDEEKNKENENNNLGMNKAFLHSNNIPKNNNNNINNNENNSEEEENENEETKNNQIQLHQKFSNVLIKEYNYFDDNPIITLIQPSELLTYNTLKIGQFLDVKIKNISDSQITCLISNYIEGIIPLFHLTDHPLKKFPKKKFKENQIIKTRIFSLNKKTKHLILTMKETLMDANVKLFSDINEIKENEIVYGIYLNKGLFEISNEIIGTLINDNNNNNFIEGKIYKLKVLKINYKMKKIYFSKDLNNNNNNINIKNVGDYDFFIKEFNINLNKENKNLDNLKNGEILFGKIHEINEKFIIISINNNNLFGIILNELFSDNKNDIKEIKINDEIKCMILYLDNQNKNIFLTSKKSLIENKEKILDENYNFENNNNYIGFINKINKKGFYIQFFGKKKILIKKNDFYSKNYEIGNTINLFYLNKKFYFDIFAYKNYNLNDFQNEAKFFYNEKNNNNFELFNKKIEIEIKEIKNDFILGEFNNKNKKEKVHVPINLFNFDFNFNKNNIIIKNNKFEGKLINFNEEKNFYVSEFPNFIINYIKNKINDSNINNNNNKFKIDENVNVKISKIKNNFIYCLFEDNKNIGRIFKNNFKGNFDKIKKILFSLNNKQNDSKINNNILNIQCKIVKINKIQTKNKKNLFIYDLIEINNENNENNNKINLNKFITDEPISKEINKDSYSVGIISEIKHLSRFPLLLNIENNNNNIKLEIPFYEIPIEMINETNLLYHIGDKIKFYYDSKTNKISLNKSSQNNNNDPNVLINKLFPCRILKKISGRGLIIEIFSNKIETFVDITEITDDLYYNPLEYYKIGQILLTRILTYNSEKKIYFCSLRESIINQKKYDLITKGTTLEFQNVFYNKENYNSYDIRNKILKFGIENSINMNDIIIGYISSSSEKGVFIKVGNNLIVRAGLNELIDENIIKPFLLFKVNNIVLCRVIYIYKENDNIKINVSLRKSLIMYGVNLRKSDIKINNFYNCLISSKNKKGFNVNIINSTFNGVLNSNNNNIKIGEIVPLQIISNENFKKIVFSDEKIKKDFDYNLIINKISEEQKEQLKNNEEIYNNILNIIEGADKEKDLIELGNKDNLKENEIDFEEIINKNNNNIFDNNNNEEEEEENEIEENDLLNDNVIINKEDKLNLLSGIENNENNIENNNNLEENTNENKNKKKSLKNDIKKEIEIREQEQNANEIKNAEYYEKKILSNKDNSFYWIEYASYILDNLNLASARKIFERAIKAISISNLQEKINIWVAYLNLENIYGDSNSFENIIQRALEVNDKKKIYLHLIDIYKINNNNNNINLINDVFKMIFNIDNNDINVWKKYFDFIFDVNYNNNNNDNNNEFNINEKLNHCLQILNNKNHLNILIYYGTLLYKYKDFEKGRNVFDKILKDFPKRIDIWFIYIDMEVKYSGNNEKVKKFFDKMFDVDFKLKQLKNLMKKYLEFWKKIAKNEKEFFQAKEKVEKIIESKMQIDDDDENKNEDSN